MDGQLLSQKNTHDLLSNIFARSEARESAYAYIEALIGDSARKTSWQMSEAAGFHTPYRFQHLLGRAVWDAEKLRARVADVVCDSLGKSNVILSVDETGFLKKGKHSAGVGRQYSGTAGRIENCQIGVFLNYSSDNGHALIDRALYLPREWTDDPSRLRAVGVPFKPGFRTKQQLALMMLQKAFDHGVAPDWVTADSFYGSDTKFRRYLEEREQPFVVGVRSTCHVASAFSYRSIAEAFRNAESLNWYRVSQGIGTKGLRVYDWCAFRCMHPYEKQWSRMAICRRSVDDPNDVRYFLAFCKSDIYVEEIIAAAGRRWTIEEDFEVTKGELGLDHYEVRSVKGWYRHITLCMAAQALLASERVQLQSSLDPGSHPIKKSQI
jgi:SRSO17 transposase